jgi:Na+-driven multidrug efflux pump
VAAFGLGTRLESIAIMPVVAISIGTLTLTGMFYGAKKYELLKNITGFSIKIAIGFTAVIGLIFFLFPKLFLRIFTSDPILLNIGGPYVKIDVFTFPFMAITMIVARALQGMGYGFPGFFISLIRIFILAVPLAYLFVFLLNLPYLWVAVAMIIGGLVSSIIGLIWLEIKIKKLNNKKSISS